MRKSKAAKSPKKGEHKKERSKLSSEKLNFKSAKHLSPRSPSPLPAHRDVFLSHRSTDKEFVRKLAADIEDAPGEPRLYVWLDEAEIRAGQSIPRCVNDGLETSKFIALVMTPDYFAGGSGWTDAEWHSMLHVDPDNRKSRILPLLSTDCPYIPALLRHFYAMDFRGNNYDRALAQLIATLRNEPLPRPTIYRGQLVTPGGRIDRASLFSERAVPTADPDVANERLYCNLLPVERLPQYVSVGTIAAKLRRRKKDGTYSIPSKEDLKSYIRDEQKKLGVQRTYTPAFRVHEDKIFTFHEFAGAVSTIVEPENHEVIDTRELLRDEDTRRIVISLINMALARHARRSSLQPDNTKIDRFFFASENGTPKKITWKPKEKTASRVVAKPWKDKNGVPLFWIHQGAYLKTIFLANKLYLQIRPTWVVTTDGINVMTGPKVTKYINRWTSPERNLQILYHVRFWTTILRQGHGLLSIRAGDQTVDFSTIPAFVDQSYGITGDNTDVMRTLDQEAEILAQAEEDLIERLPDITEMINAPTEEDPDNMEAEEAQ